MEHEPCLNMIKFFHKIESAGMEIILPISKHFWAAHAANALPRACLMDILYIELNVQAMNTWIDSKLSLCADYE